MADLDLRACWVAAMWCGIPQHLIRERTEPLSDKGERIVRKAVEGALVGHPYLEESAQETLSELEKLNHAT